jgi:hypothetical protein
MALAELLWGGLRPIAGQVVLDILALIGFGALAVAKPQVSKLKSCQPSSAMANSHIQNQNRQYSKRVIRVAFLPRITIGDSLGIGLWFGREVHQSMDDCISNDSVHRSSSTAADDSSVRYYY